MQIFATHSDPIYCALVLDDKRLNKQVLECAQILSTIFPTAPGAYKPTHAHHPITKWARRNASWVYRYALACVAEVAHRTGHVHKCFPAFLARLSAPSARTPRSFVNVARRRDLGLDFTLVPNVHLAYRAYLAHRWHTDKRPPRWTNRERPWWPLINDVYYINYSPAWRATGEQVRVHRYDRRTGDLILEHVQRSCSYYYATYEELGTRYVSVS